MGKILFCLIWFLVFGSFSCCTCDKSKTSISSVSVMYIKGRVESPVQFDCNRIMFMDRIKLDTVLNDSKDLIEIEHLLLNLKDQQNDSNCDIRICCKVNYINNKSVNLSIGTSNCIAIDGIRKAHNDTLVYLIKNRSGYYNYFSKEEFVLFDELLIFGVPKDYNDLSKRKLILPELRN